MEASCTEALFNLGMTLAFGLETENWPSKRHGFREILSGLLEISLDIFKKWLSRGYLSRGGGGGVLPYKRLMGMCRWMG